MKKQIKPHPTRVLFVITLSLLLLLGGCTAPADTAGPTQSPAQSSPPAQESPGGSAPAQPTAAVTEANEHISFITQEYIGANIAEIPYIAYDGDEIEAIEQINRLYNQGLQVRYETFIKSDSDWEWIEIKSYPFTTDDYLQIVTTYAVFPNYGTDGKLESVNYDRVNQAWLSVDDALHMLNMSADEVATNVSAAYFSEVGESVSDVSIDGFLIHETPGETVVELLLNLTLRYPESDERTCFYSYTPADAEFALQPLNPYCLFDPYDMDEMDPPLSYARNADRAMDTDLDLDMIILNGWVDIDSGDTMYFYPELFAELSETWEEDPEGLYYSYTGGNTIGLFLDGAFLNNHYYEFDPETRVLSEYLYNDVLAQWRIADE